MKKPEFRSKKMRVQTAGEVRYNGIPNAPDIMEFAKCIVRNVHELDKVLERLHLMDHVDLTALLRVSQQDPYIASLIIDYFERTCNPKANNPR